MRYFNFQGDIYFAQNGQYTQDEKQALIDVAKTQQELASANAIIACAPEGAVELTGQDLEDALNPLKSYDEEQEELNIEFEKKMSDLVRKHSLAIARNGVTENAKVDAARQKIIELDLWYEAEQEKLIIKYFS